MAPISRLRRRLGAALLLIALGAASAARAQTLAAPALTVTTLDGQSIRLNDRRGKVMLVTFWATSCSICLSEMPDLVQVYRQYRPRGLEVIAIAMPYDAGDAIRLYVARQGLPFPVVWDRTGDIGRSFRDVIGTPTTFVIDPRGRLISKTTGPIDFQKLRRFLEGALR